MPQHWQYLPGPFLHSHKVEYKILMQVSSQFIILIGIIPFQNKGIQPSRQMRHIKYALPFLYSPGLCTHWH